jgi:hypothetical protein
MSIWDCGSLATSCQPSATSGFIYADWRRNLNVVLICISFMAKDVEHFVMCGFFFFFIFGHLDFLP